MRAQAVSLALLLLASGPLAAFAEATEPQAAPSWQQTAGLVYDNVEGGILKVISSLHANNPLAKSIRVDSSSTDFANASQDVATIKDAMPEMLTSTSATNSRRLLHSEWSGGLRGRRLAQAPVQVLTAIQPTCKSVTCGGQCCDAFFTYSSNANTSCTQPNPTCSASNTCTYSATNNSQCPGMDYGFHPFPGSTNADNPSNQVGYACPSGGNSQCSYLNTFSADLSACTVGACIPTTSGGLSCVPIIKGIVNFGCAAAIQTFTGGVQINAALNTAVNLGSANAGLSG